jgi:hypothetical protein
VLNLTARTSADPMISKQMLAIAEGLMDEVAAQPFTWCDPDDPSAATAINAAACATQEVTAPGAPEAGETRGGPAPFFDNVNDYNGCGPGVVACNLASPIPSITGNLTAPAGLQRRDHGRAKCARTGRQSWSRPPLHCSSR